MAPSGPRDEEDVADPEAADDATGEDEFDGFRVDDQDLPLEEDAAYDADDGFVDGDALPDATDEDDDGDDGAGDEDHVAPLLAADEDLAEVVAAVDEEPDTDDAVREGEFICRSCFMAKRDSALADEDALLCRDCV